MVKLNTFFLSFYRRNLSVLQRSRFFNISPSNRRQSGSDPIPSGTQRCGELVGRVDQHLVGSPESGRKSSRLRASAVRCSLRDPPTSQNGPCVHLTHNSPVCCSFPGRCPRTLTLETVAWFCLFNFEVGARLIGG